MNTKIVDLSDVESLLSSIFESHDGVKTTPKSKKHEVTEEYLTNLFQYAADEGCSKKDLVKMIGHALDSADFQKQAKKQEALKRKKELEEELRNLNKTLQD